MYSVFYAVGIIVLLFSRNPAECWLDFNPLRC